MKARALAMVVLAVVAVLGTAYMVHHELSQAGAWLR